jgi:3-phenylpropionate/trans-cinnamate dioxygenase ferredoxin reductase subunit
MAATVVILGAGLAGGTAAATLRAQGFDGRVVLVGAEPWPPYERPPLSKEFLRGESAFETAAVRPPEFWEEQAIECRFGQAATVDARASTVVLAGGEAVPFDQLLVATGLANRRLSVPGATLDGIHSLRTIGEAEQLRTEMAAASAAVVVGMGFIGAEVAASLRSSGVEVTAIDPLPGPVYRAFGPGGSAVVEAIHRDHGVRMHFGEGVASFEGSRRVEAVVTTSGQRIACDLAVVGVGTLPLTGALEGTGVAIGNGVLVDEHCRTNIDGIFAAGDVANHYHPAYGTHVRVEHWHNALKQGEAAAKSMLGGTEPYDEVHWFWSDQYHDNIQCAGRIGDWHGAVIRGDVEGRRFAAFFLDGDRLAGALAVNLGRDLRRALPLIRAAAVMDPAALADPGVDVRSARAAPGPPE